MVRMPIDAIPSTQGLLLMSLRIVIADDHTLMRAGLRSLLERDLGHQVLGEASNGREVC